MAEESPQNGTPLQISVAGTATEPETPLDEGDPSGTPMLEQPEPTKNSSHRSKLIRTLWLALNVAACGMCVGLRGPTLLDLQRLSGSTFTQISIAVFTSMAIGWLIGGMAGGVILDKYNKNLVMGTAGLGAGVFTLCVPWNHNTVVLGIIIGASGAFISAYEAGAFTLCFGLWGARAGPYSQALVLLFSLGSFIAPLIVEGFLKLSLLHNHNIQNITLIENNSTNISNVSISNGSLDNTTLSKQNCKETNTVGQYNDMFWCAYVVIGSLTLLSSLAFFVNAYFNVKYEQTNKNDTSVTQLNNKKQCFIIQILTLLVVFSFFNSAIEEILGGFLKVFSIKQFCWSESRGNLLISLYFGVYTFARLLGVLESLFLHPGTIVILHLMMLTVAFFSFFVALKWEFWLWVCSVIVGVAIAPIWPARIAWTDQYIKVNGKIIGLIFVREGAGSMIWPSLAGFLIDIYGSMFFVYLLCIMSCIAFIVFVIMHCIARSYDKRF